ncbi:putative DNA mismatch repair protein Msh6 [Myxozyma melibiosi]|uniref:DNA mismatch repair protein n=1 Tax=Myxozyma melibiosi TaxID=54550 RepID=A0ABR1F932_9ASCO
MAPAAAAKSQTPASSNKKQRTLASFFGKPKSEQTTTTSTPLNSSPLAAKSSANAKAKRAILAAKLDSDPVDAGEDDSRRRQQNEDSKRRAKDAFPSPDTPSIKSSSPEAEKDNEQSSSQLSSATPSRRAKARVHYSEVSDDDDEADTTTKSKRQKIENDDSEDEFIPAANRTANDSFEHMSEIEIDEDYDSMDDFVVADDFDEDEPKPKRKRPAPKKAKKASPSASTTTPAPVKSENFISPVSTPSSALELKSKFGALSRDTAKSGTSSSSSAAKAKPRASPASSAPEKKSFEKQNEERYAWLVDVRDADGHPVDHPDYDPRTLYIPKSAWAKFTAFETQYWEVKSKMYDTVVFFKKGKFYELYERDADIAHGEFDLKIAGGGRANMRLAGVPEMSFDYWASAFIAKGHKVAKVVQTETMLGKEMREKGGKKEEKIIRRELSCVLTGGTLVDETMLTDEMSTFCVAIKEGVSETGTPMFGVCYVDTATGAFSLTQLEDDVDYNMFQTVIAQLRPKELILEKGVISPLAVRIIKNNTSPGTIWNYIKPRTEFWPDDIAIEELSHGAYFPGANIDDRSQWPEILQSIEEHPFALSALGGLLWYLKQLRIDKELVSLGNFTKYDPVRTSSSLVLDGQSLQNLEIFANSYDGGDQGTLFRLLNRCITPFGKRQLRNWLCHPLQDVDLINARLDAVDLLNSNYELQSVMEKGLSSLPDLERLVSRIHADKCKVSDFLRVIEAFERIYELLVTLRTEFKLGGLIGKLIETIPDMEECLSMWRDAFDRQKAKNEGLLVPERGVEEDFDNSQDNMQRIEEELMTLLRGYRRQFKSQEISFKDSGKEIYLIEVPARIVNAIPKDWQQLGGTQKMKRFWSPEVRTLVREMLEARETHKSIVSEMQSRLYARFDKYYKIWLKATKLVSNLDCLVSLAKTTASLGTPSCRPQFVQSERSVLDFKELRHPCYSSDHEFIPNDVALGGETPNITLLTGANAAGKSTILRMTCVAAIMAQIGCYVPAESARMTPVDRIMTRLGANDNIFAGQSTFYVELSETKKMLSQATNRSLLVLDELGRGGSSSDGFAIAESVLYHIATHIGSLGFFATHYGTLAASFTGHPEVEPKRMAILVDEDERRVTFLYRLEHGVSPGSFGMHVASMCGVDRKIVDEAEVAAKQYEHTTQAKKLLETTSSGAFVPLGLQSDFSWLMKLAEGKEEGESQLNFASVLKEIDNL